MSTEIWFKYQLVFESKAQKNFVIRLNNQTLNIITEPKTSYPPWTKLTCNQCPHCPLDNSITYCPIAKNLVDIIDTFKDSLSYEKVTATVETRERTYSKETDLQTAISSLIGIIMVTSGCPIMDKLKPMVRFHLPFAYPEETMYRSVSNYLLAQYIRKKKGYEPDWDLKILHTIYEGINLLNMHFILRLKEIDIQDSTLTAITTLDCFAQIIGLSFEGIADNFQDIFQSYL